MKRCHPPQSALGLPDPTRHIPPSNPPTLAKWHLGKKLFFDDKLLLPQGTARGESCASCHKPKQGFNRLARATAQRPLQP